MHQFLRSTNAVEVSTAAVVITHIRLQIAGKVHNLHCVAIGPGENRTLIDTNYLPNKYQRCSLCRGTMSQIGRLLASTFVYPPVWLMISSISMFAYEGSKGSDLFEFASNENGIGIVEFYMNPSTTNLYFLENTVSLTAAKN